MNPSVPNMPPGYQSILRSLKETSGDPALELPAGAALLHDLPMLCTADGEELLRAMDDDGYVEVQVPDGAGTWSNWYSPTREGSEKGLWNWGRIVQRAAVIRAGFAGPVVTQPVIDRDIDEWVRQLRERSDDRTFVEDLQRRLDRLRKSGHVVGEIELRPSGLAMSLAPRIQITESGLIVLASLDTHRQQPEVSSEEEKPKRAVKRPSDNAMAAWRLRDLKGLKDQNSTAEEMSRQLGRTVSQGSVSRWLKQVDDYLEDGKTLPGLPPPAKKPTAMDPQVIDVGQRRDRRVRAISTPSQIVDLQVGSRRCLDPSGFQGCCRALSPDAAFRD